MNLKKELLRSSRNPDMPFLRDGQKTVSLRNVLEAPVPADDLQPGEVAALIGDFDAGSLSTLIDLVSRGIIVMPLAMADSGQIEVFLQSGHANAVIGNGKYERLGEQPKAHPLVEELRESGHAGLILFTSGTTGRPKAILHDFDKFIARFSLPRKAYTTLNFLLFDHIGGLNTLFHTMFNGGLVVRPGERSPEAVLKTIEEANIELLPTTPTFLRMLAMSGRLRPEFMRSLKLITYGTERMDQNTLDMVATALPDVDLRQTYGMSELGILRVKTRKRDELWIRPGGEGTECRIEDGELFISSQNRMLGYLNAESPFDQEGWLATKDLVETDGSWLRIVGRRDGIINVGGLKVFPAEVEHAALSFPGIRFARAKGRPNPLTGMHVELQCEPNAGQQVDKTELSRFLAGKLAPHARPRRIIFGPVDISPRCKQL